MSTVENDLTSFNDFVRKYLAESGEKSRSIDELFDLWRGENTAEDYSRSSADIKAALDDHRRGIRGTSAEEHIAELRQQYGLNDE